MYHIRIDYYDRNLKTNQTRFDYDYKDVDEVINKVTSKYLAGDVMVFSGSRISSQDIRQVSVYVTEHDISTMKQIADDNVGQGILFVYSRPDVLKDNSYSKDVTREIMEETQAYLSQKAIVEKAVAAPEKEPLLFISHSTANENIAENIVHLLRTLGFNNKNLFCSSVPGYDIKEGEDIYDTLASKFHNYNIIVIFLLSKDYYESAACLNEMGATWVLKANYSTILCPGFSIPEIKGAVNPSKMAVVLEDAKRVNGKLNQLKDRLIDFFNLPEIDDDTIWESDRNKFIEIIKQNHEHSKQI